MNFSTFFTHLLTTLGIHSSTQPIAQPIVNPSTVGPLIAATNGPIIPLINLNSNTNNYQNSELNTQHSILKCGLSLNTTFTTKMSTKIIGGSVVKISDYPWQVSIQRWTGNGWAHTCGGSIIHPKWVMTAAHCLEWAFSGRTVQIGAVESVRIMGGSETIYPSIKSLMLSVNGLLIHPFYNPDKYYNDIGLISLGKSINFLGNNMNVNAICLPSSTERLNKMLTTTGWGDTSEDGDNSVNLKAVNVPLISTRKCKSEYGSDYVPSLMICAGAEGKDSCQGDSGGALIQRDRTGRATVVGIVSEGNGCGRRGFPGVYTKVSHFIAWINTITRY